MNIEAFSGFHIKYNVFLDLINYSDKKLQSFEDYNFRLKNFKVYIYYPYIAGII